MKKSLKTSQQSTLYAWLKIPWLQNNNDPQITSKRGSMQSRGIQNRRTAPGWLTVMGIFAKIGTTSFGGGSATIAAIRQACIRHGWMSEQQFIEIVVLSRLTPGISILAQTLLIGRAVAGIAGMFAALIGLLTPSLII